MRLFTLIIIGLFLLSTTLTADVSDDALAQLFNGMADIVERNMNNPSNCVKELGEFIRKNKPLFLEWKETVQRNIERTRSYPNKMPTRQELERMEQEMSKSQGFVAMNRWGESISNFMMQNPGYMEKINEISQEISPNPRGY